MTMREHLVGFRSPQIPEVDFVMQSSPSQLLFKNLQGWEITVVFRRRADPLVLPTLIGFFCRRIRLKKYERFWRMRRLLLLFFFTSGRALFWGKDIPSVWKIDKYWQLNWLFVYLYVCLCCMVIHSTFTFDKSKGDIKKEYIIVNRSKASTIFSFGRNKLGESRRFHRIYPNCESSCGY